MRLINWRNFWILWLCGLALLFELILTNHMLVTSAAPRGILDHQSAGSAANVDSIYASWVAGGVVDFAQWSMIKDLIFITFYTVGGIIGGRLIWQNGVSPRLKKLGLLIILSYFLFGLFDYVETVSELVQHLSGRGSDWLAAIAAFCQIPKTLAWLVATLAMISALIWHRFERLA